VIDMQDTRAAPKTVRERLRWIARYSLPRRRQVSGPKYYLVVLTLLGLLIGLIAIGSIAGIAASDIVRAYADF